MRKIAISFVTLLMFAVVLPPLQLIGGQQGIHAQNELDVIVSDKPPLSTSKLPLSNVFPQYLTDWRGPYLNSGAEPHSAAEDINSAHWPEWRGPYRNGMARGDAPTTWSDTKNVKWKTEIPGRGFSTPVIWGDKVFLTTAVQTGKTPEPSPTPADPAAYRHAAWRADMRARKPRAW